MVKVVLPQMALRFPKAVKTDVGKFNRNFRT